MTPREKPIKLHIYPFGSSENIISHAIMEYDGEVVNYSSRGFSKNAGQSDGCYIYEVYPSEVGIDGEKLKQAIQNRKTKVAGKDYNFLTENCADQIVAVLEEAGAKDISKTLGISIPKLDGVSSLDDWAEKHGKLVQKPENFHASLRQYLKAAYNHKTVSNVKFIEDKNTVQDCLDVIKDRETYLKKIKKDYEGKCAKSSLLDQISLRHEYVQRYALTLLSPEQLAKKVALITNDYNNKPTEKQHLINCSAARVLVLKNRNLLTETMKDTLEQAGYSPMQLGRQDKSNTPQQKKQSAPEQKQPPTINIYNQDSHTA